MSYILLQYIKNFETYFEFCLKKLVIKLIFRNVMEKINIYIYMLEKVNSFNLFSSKLRFIIAILSKILYYPEIFIDSIILVFFSTSFSNHLLLHVFEKIK